MNDIGELDLNIEALKDAKDEAIDCGDYPLAAKIRDRLDAAKLEKQQKLKVDQKDIITVAKALGIPESEIVPEDEKDEECEDIYALQAWNEVAVQSNQDVLAYLQEQFPMLKLDGGMPIDNVRKVVKYLKSNASSAGEVTHVYPPTTITLRPSGAVPDQIQEEDMPLHVRDIFLDIIECTEPNAQYLRTLDTLAYINWWAHQALDHTSFSEGGPQRTISEWMEEVSHRPKTLALVDALKKLSGDLSYDNVAAAKEILKKIIG